MEFDTQVKLYLYRAIAETARIPTAHEVADSIGVSMVEVEAAFRILYQKRLLVLEPGSSSRIRMAPPFSGIETPFRVHADGKSFFANCAWDALGIPAALHLDGDIEAADGFSGEPLSFQVRGGNPVARDCAIHFAVPAAHWWDDIIYT